MVCQTVKSLHHFIFYDTWIQSNETSISFSVFIGQGLTVCPAFFIYCYIYVPWAISDLDSVLFSFTHRLLHECTINTTRYYSSGCSSSSSSSALILLHHLFLIVMFRVLRWYMDQIFHFKFPFLYSLLLCTFSNSLTVSSDWTHQSTVVQRQLGLRWRGNSLPNYTSWSLFHRSHSRWQYRDYLPIPYCLPGFELDQCLCTFHRPPLVRRLLKLTKEGSYHPARRDDRRLYIPSKCCAR